MVDSMIQMNLLLIIVNQAYFSGAMIDYLNGMNRILITAADSDHESWVEYAYKADSPFQHFAFIYQGKGWWWQTHDGFIRTLGNIINPSNIKNAYDNGVEAVNINIQNTPSNPQIDDNFNGLSAEDGDNNDGAYASKIYL